MREINLLFFELYQAYHLYKERIKEIWEEWLNHSLGLSQSAPHTPYS